MVRKLKQKLEAGNTLTVTCQQETQPKAMKEKKQVTITLPEVTRSNDVNQVVGFKKGKPLLAPKPSAVDIKTEVPEEQKVHNGVDMFGKKPDRKKKSPVIKTTKQHGAMLKKDNKNSWWNTKPGILRRIALVRGMLKGTYRKDGIKTMNKSKKAEAMHKIQKLEKQLKELE